jgi:hypothetical protein
MLVDGCEIGMHLHNYDSAWITRAMVFAMACYLGGMPVAIAADKATAAATDQDNAGPDGQKANGVVFSQEISIRSSRISSQASVSG